METVKSAWHRISAWYAANTPDGTLVLAPGASEIEIVNFENEIGLHLPEDLRASFALHNGTLNEGYLLYHGELLSLKKISKLCKEYSQWQKNENWGLGPDYETDFIEGPIKPIWWNPLRIPLTDNSGDGVMADFDPATGGQLGQIIEFDHEVGPRKVFASGFGRWLNYLADGLEKGDYVYIEDAGCVAPPGMW
jgi:cell wall assembly regulator SMI1